MQVAKAVDSTKRMHTMHTEQSEASQASETNSDACEACNLVCYPNQASKAITKLELREMPLAQ